MKRFTRLYCELDQTNRTNEKVEAIARYFRDAPPADAAWGLTFLIGRIPPRGVSSRHMRQWAAEATGYPSWILDECYDAVGDSAETLALLIDSVTALSLGNSSSSRDGAVEPNAGELLLGTSPRPFAVEERATVLDASDSTGTTLSLAEIVHERLLKLRALPERDRREMLIRTWRELNSAQRLVWNKLISGEFRIGAARTLVVRALASVVGIDPAIMAHRVMGDWPPTAEAFSKLVAPEGETGDLARPYPFFLASPIEMATGGIEGRATREWASALQEALGPVSDWLAEWKWDGIRSQLICRGGEVLIWSRGEEMVTETFPEIAEAARLLPDGTVLDGELLAWQGGQVQSFAKLQRRLGRKVVAEKMRNDFPVAFLGYDCLEWQSKDVRELPQVERRALLEELLADCRRRAALTGATRSHAVETPLLLGFEEGIAPGFPLQISPQLTFATWDELTALQKQSRARGVEGLMLKRRTAAYAVGRPRGDWWKWKIDPYVIDAVLIYAQRGSGKRASLYSDYTFGLWDNGELVPMAKAYSGLTDQEIKKVDEFVRRNTLETHGPVRIVRPELVFELAFEGIQESTRHRAGIAVRFPRMNRWRTDKKPTDADTVEALRALAK